MTTTTHTATSYEDAIDSAPESRGLEPVTDQPEDVLEPEDYDEDGEIILGFNEPDYEAMWEGRAERYVEDCMADQGYV